MAKKRISFEVDGSRLSTVMSALGPVLSSISGMRVDDVEQPARTRATKRFKVLGEKRAGLVDTIKSAFPNKPVFEISLDTLYDAVVSAGYARTSMSSTMSKLAAAGWSIRRTESGYVVARPDQGNNFQKS